MLPLVRMMKKLGSPYLNCCDAGLWTVVDPNSDFSFNSPACDRWTADTMNQNINAHISVDFGAAYFGTSFEIQWSSFKGSGGDQAKMVMCIVSNDSLGTWRRQVFNGAQAMGVYNAINLAQTYISVGDFPLSNEDLWYQGAYPFPQMWFKLIRIGASLTLYTYDDAARTSLIKTQAIVCHETDTFRYLHITGSGGVPSGDTDPYTGWIEKIQIVSH